MTDADFEPLSPAGQRWLLSWARACIRCHLNGLADPELGDDAPPESVWPRGCFVSLHSSDGNLRGCIGTFEAKNPLWSAVRDMAVAASTRDPRFSRMTSPELDDCVIEISVLTARRPAQPEEVQVGRHGIEVEQGVRRGVLLPQVATHHGWDRETFLDNTCRKAGLAPQAWRSGDVKISLFAADVFGEPDGPDS